MITSEDIRKLRKEFWEHPDRNHKWLPPDKLIPTTGDTTAMFTIAWMQQLVPYLMWKQHLLWKRLYNIQKCIRTNDIDEVGDERHLTFFEMMWNWSLWDYFKKETIHWSKQFLTDYLKLDINKLWATIFKWEDSIPKDIESEKYWQEEWISKYKIKALGKDDNFRWPAWEIWPCWPCTEIYFDRGDIWWEWDWNLWENDRYLEIRNDVFMEFYKDEKWNYNKLQQKNVDTGMWLERITMVMQGVPTVFETDLFEPIIKTIEKYVEKKYPMSDLFYNKIINLSIDEIKDKINNFLNISSELSSDVLLLRRFRIIADHIRSSIFLISDGVIPSNEWRWYVLRRLIRRLYYNMILINENITIDFIKKFIEDIVNIVVDKYWPWRWELVIEKQNIKNILFQEIKKFDNTIKRWLKLIENKLSNMKVNDIISWETVFKLYDTYGFPVELTKEIAESKWFKIDIEGFKKLLEEAKNKSRQATKEVFKRWIDWSKYIEGLPPTQFVWYETLELENPKLLKDFEIEINWKKQRILIFDKTPFYAESGWQTWDKWEIILDNWEVLKIKDVQKVAGVFLHFVE